MEAFTDTVSDRRVADSLADALRGGRPFRRFKDAIARHPAEEERWYTFEAERQHERLVDWLRSEGIEPIE
jgi:hypothetical protein